MSALPANFPVNDLSAVNRSRIEGFYRLFAENYYNEYQLGHFLLAAYAAVPSLLTPELLYRIWQNFNGYRWSGAAATIHRIAVSDVLLSPLCRETGFELYEMEPEIKLAFLEWLKKIETDKGSHWAQRGIHTIDSIASFVGYYHRSPNSGLARWGKVYTDLQEMEVLSYTDPGRLAGVLLAQIRSQAAAKDENALLRTLDIFLKTQQRLDRLLPEEQKVKAFEDPKQELAAIKDLLQKNEDGFLEKLQASPAVKGQLSEVNGGGIELKIKQQVAGKIAQLEKPQLRILAIGPSGTDELGINFSGQIDTLAVVDCLRKLFPAGTPLEIKTLLGPEATRNRIMAALEELRQQSTEADDILVYISSSGQLFEEGCCLLTSDATGDREKAPVENTFITDREFNAATKLIRCYSLTAIIEADFSGAGRWLEVEEQNNRLLITASAAGEEVGGASLHGDSGAAFTTWLVQTWDRSESLLNWRELMTSVLYWQSKAKETPVYPLINQHPTIKANLVTLNNVLGTAGHVSRQLETLLRQTGFYTPDNPHASYSEALNKFCVATSRQTGLPEGQYIQLLEEYRKDQLQSSLPVYLLVFSDPDKRLPELKRELVDLKEILLEMVETSKIELLVLEDPTPWRLANTLSDPQYRNRIQVLYLSGNDQNGDLILREGIFGIDQLGRLLNYQENIDLLVCNTCRSAQLASYASQLGVRMAIGMEGIITDDTGADFGVQLFDWIYERKDLLAFEAACQSGTLTFRQLSDNVKPFRFFYPPWVKEPFVLTERRKGQVQPGTSQKQKRKIYAAVTGANTYTLRRKFSLRYGEQNATRFVEVMDKNAATLGRELEIFPETKLARSSLTSLKDFYDQCQPGDTCLLFYSGVARVDKDGMLEDIVYVDDNIDSLLLREQSIITTLFRSLAEQNRGHILIILDIQNVNYESMVIHPLPSIDDRHSPFLILVSSDHLADLGNREHPEGNYFFESLVDLLEDGGPWLTYRDLYDKLRLRMSRFTVQKPFISYLNKEVLDTIVFTGEGRLNNQYKLSWSEDLNSWIVDAGSLQGIRPSLRFMHTIFHTEEGRPATVTRVLPNRSQVEAFEGDVNVVYRVTLVQNALPKVKIAFAPSIFHAMRERMEQAIRQYDIYYTEIVTTVADAVYFIGNKDDQYLLIRRADLQVDEPVPVFGYQSDPYELIRQIEYIAQWQGVLEFNNPNTSLGRDDIWLTFEKVEGANRDNRETVPGEIVRDDEPVELYYTKENNQWLQPALRCRAAVVKRPVYVFIMYLDARYGITYLGSTLLEPSSEGDYISFKLDYRERDQRTLLFRLERKYEERGMTRITEYMKFFISEGPVDFDRLRQEGLEFGETTKRKGLDSDIRADSVNMSSSDWMSYTIPIRIIKEESKESEAPVQQETPATSEAQPPNKPQEATRQTPLIFILFLYGRSRDQELLRMQYDIQHIRNAIQRSSMRDRISFTIRLVEKSHDIIEGLVSYKPTIVHLSGLSDQGWSIQTEIGEPQLVTTEMLLHLFEQHMDFIQCVILEGVYTDKLVSGLLLLVPYTIALTPNLTNRAVSDFYSKFYEAVANGQTIEFAFEIAQAAQSLSIGDRSSTPRLYKKD